MSGMPYRLSIQAEADIEDILIQGVLRFGRAQAVKYQQSLHKTFDALASMPLMGRLSERYVPDERRWTTGPHVIYYSVDEYGIIIQDIIPSAMVRDAWGDE